jgi:hypothetical protein
MGCLTGILPRLYVLFLVTTGIPEIFLFLVRPTQKLPQYVGYENFSKYAACMTEEG